jgi:predicted ArsR family transcriptional regulator
MTDYTKPANLPIKIDRDLFLRNLIRELSGALEDVIGLEEASGFISIVGQQIGDWMNAEYREAYNTDTLSPEQVAEVLVDLKARIQGDFFIIEEDDEKIVLGNRRCPFGEKVKDRPSMCMMTSNVFGTITAENLGYAKVNLIETIAQGAPGCKVTVYKQQTEAAMQDDGREYYKA